MLIIITTEANYLKDLNTRIFNSTVDKGYFPDTTKGGPWLGESTGKVLVQPASHAADLHPRNKTAVTSGWFLSSSATWTLKAAFPAAPLKSARDAIVSAPDIAGSQEEPSVVRLPDRPKAREWQLAMRPVCSLILSQFVTYAFLTSSDLAAIKGRRKSVRRRILR